MLLSSTDQSTPGVNEAMASTQSNKGLCELGPVSDKGIESHGGKTKRRSMDEEVCLDSLESQETEPQKVTAKRLRVLVERQSFKCALSGQEITPDWAALDHITPKSEGGRHTMGNVQWVDPRVNTMKGTMGQSEFISLCVAVAKQKGTPKDNCFF